MWGRIVVRAPVARAHITCDRAMANGSYAVKGEPSVSLLKREIHR